jgi:ferritin-like metal-binding protein YciE
MKQASTARRSSGQKSKSSSQKKQENAGNKSTRSSSRSASDGQSSGKNDSARQQGEKASVMRPSSGTMERGVSASGSGLSKPREFKPDNGQYLEKFFLEQLKDIYYAEQKIAQSLPKMQEAATTEELKDAFEDHLYQTQRHARRLEKVFEALGQKAEGKKCEAIEGIVREAEQIIEETEENTMTRDAALIMAAQKVEHYEIASYGGLVQLAITMGQYEVAELLDRTLIEEEDTDLLLTEIAECEINVMAEFEGIQAGDSEEGEEEDEEGEDEEDEDEQGQENMQENETQEEV